MEIRDVSSLASSANDIGGGATVTPLYPSTAWGQGLVAVDLWEVAPGGSMSRHIHPEEHVLFVLSGQGRIMGDGQDGSVAAIRENSIVYLGPQESHQLKNTGTTPLRILVSTPLLVRSERAYGISKSKTSEPETPTPSRSPSAPTQEATPRVVERSSPVGREVSESEKDDSQAAATIPTPPSKPASEEDGDQPASIAGMMKASALKDQPRPERRRPAPPPEEEPQPEEQAQPEEDTEEQSNLMELFVAFDGGIRGATAQGFGRYLVQSPGRKPVVKAAEFAANYTPAQAQYESLIEALRYIVARLEATGRTAEQVQLDIRSGNENVVNGLLGTMKVKEPALRKRQEQALELLAHFADWRIEWHSPEESTRLLG